MRYFPLLTLLYLIACNPSTETDMVLSGEKREDSLIFIIDSLRYIQDSLIEDNSLRNERHPKGYEDISRFKETGLVNLQLFDEEALAKLLGKEPSFLTDTMKDAQLFDYARFHLLNASQSQLASLHQWVTDAGNEVSEIKVRYVEGKRHYPQKPEVIKVATFVSSKGIQLGMSLEEVLEKFGEPSVTGQAAMYYYIAYQAKDDLYYGNYYFDDTKLVYFEFGYPNP
ncbi:hypothetical protein BH09BAC1_BH09BAC1_17360 [soil metagenome]